MCVSTDAEMHGSRSKTIDDVVRVSGILNAVTSHMGKALIL